MGVDSSRTDWRTRSGSAPRTRASHSESFSREQTLRADLEAATPSISVDSPEPHSTIAPCVRGNHWRIALRKGSLALQASFPHDCTNCFISCESGRALRSRTRSSEPSALRSWMRRRELRRVSRMVRATARVCMSRSVAKVRRLPDLAIGFIRVCTAGTALVGRYRAVLPYLE